VVTDGDDDVSVSVDASDVVLLPTHLSCLRCDLIKGRGKREEGRGKREEGRGPQGTG
jgi:hypothetical protein